MNLTWSFEDAQFDEEQIIGVDIRVYCMAKPSHRQLVNTASVRANKATQIQYTLDVIMNLKYNLYEGNRNHYGRPKREKKLPIVSRQ